MIDAFEPLPFRENHRVGKIAFPFHGDPSVPEGQAYVRFYDFSRLLVLLRLHILEPGVVRAGIAEVAHGHELDRIIRHMVIPGDG